MDVAYTIRHWLAGIGLKQQRTHNRRERQQQIATWKVGGCPGPVAKSERVVHRSRLAQEKDQDRKKHGNVKCVVLVPWSADMIAVASREQIKNICLCNK